MISDGGGIMNKLRGSKIKRGQPRRGRPRRRVIVCSTAKEFKGRLADLLDGRIRGPVEIVLT